MIERYEAEADWEGLVVTGEVVRSSASAYEAPWTDVRRLEVELGGDTEPEALWRVRDSVGPCAHRVLAGYCRITKSLPGCARDWFLSVFDDHFRTRLLVVSDW